ncbi:MAG: LacI family transcriptional regulator [Hyphomicrobiales bacterium]|nr:MAG: LacI family transcriptional regulator [Hyphomicrobiales bacterium]
MPTMKDVAKAAGVSIATVSATLSGASYVSPELQVRVNAAIAALGYERNSMASGLKRGRSSLIGLIVSDVTNPFFTELVDHVQKHAQHAGYSVLLGISDHSVTRERELLRLMRSHQAAGTIMCPAGNSGDYAPQGLSLGHMRLVAVDNAAAELPFDTVTMDNTLAADMATQHILSFGHRQVATVAGFATQTVSQRRLEGFLQAMAAKGLSVDPRFICRGDFRIEEAYRACRDLLARKPWPSAIFVANNLMLIGTMQALAEAGLRVPQDMSVASIDDFPWAAAFHPGLTVVRQPIARMASAALTCLTERLAGDDAPPRHTDFAPELVVRQSCAPPAAR